MILLSLCVEWCIIFLASANVLKAAEREEKSRSTPATTSTKGGDEKPPEGPCVDGSFHSWKSEGTRIIDGELVQKGEFPYAVALIDLSRTYKRKYPEGYMIGRYPFCGGTLVSSRFVISACHCLKDFKYANRLRQPENIEINAGNPNICLYPEKPGEQKVDPPVTLVGLQVNVHPNCGLDFSSGYNTGFKWDTGLIHVKDGFTLIPGKIEAMPLHLFQGTRKVDQDGEIQLPCWVLGWGDNRSGARTYHLRKARVTLRSPKVCEDMIKKATAHLEGGSADYTNVYFICTTSSSTACNGDSGGTLVCGEGKERHLYGTVAWSHSCGNASIPVVYSRLDAQLTMDYLWKKVTRDPEARFTGYSGAVGGRTLFSRTFAAITTLILALKP